MKCTIVKARDKGNNLVLDKMLLTDSHAEALSMVREEYPNLHGTPLIASTYDADSDNWSLMKQYAERGGVL